MAREFHGRGFVRDRRAGGQRIGQGRENAKTYLRENPELAYELEMLIRDSYDIMPLGAYAGDDDDDSAIVPADED